MRYFLSDPCHFHRSKFRPTNKFMKTISKGGVVNIGNYENLVSLTQFGDGEYPAYRHSRSVDKSTGLYPFKYIGVDAGMIALIKLDEKMIQGTVQTVIAEKPYFKVTLHGNGVISFFNGNHLESIFVDTGEIYAQLRLARMRKLNAF